MATRSWSALGAPFDSAGVGEGEERAPQALRSTGFLERIGARDRGDVASTLRPAERDPHSGIIAFEQLVTASEALSGEVADSLARDESPLVLGGDCTLLIGVAAGLRAAGLDPWLWFVDGHADYFDGDSSPTGEGADMELAILHGSGPDELAAIRGQRPLIAAERTTILGHRPPELHPDVALERSRVPESVLQLDTPSIRELGAARAGRISAERVGGDGAWLHLDLDVLDQAELPAVSYPQPGGLTWAELDELLAALAGSDRLIGVSVADYNPDLDPDAAYARRIAETLTRALSNVS
ncbi:MAG: arginase family protein [Actinomycetota bacterium]|nr:arginase family protein [Actinomycetota bacterium]